MRKSLLLVFVLVGCGGKPKTPVSSLDAIQGNWKVVEATDPKGKGYDASAMNISISGNIATCRGGVIILSFKGDYLTLKISSPDGDKVVGETKVYLSTPQEDEPLQMLWEEKNSKQKTLFEKEKP